MSSSWMRYALSSVVHSVRTSPASDSDSFSPARGPAGAARVQKQTAARAASHGLAPRLLDAQALRTLTNQSARLWCNRFRKPSPAVRSDQIQACQGLLSGACASHLRPTRW